MKIPPFAAALLYASGTAALAGSPRLSYVSPAAVTRGGEQQMTFEGGNLADARTLLFDEPGFSVTWVSADKGAFFAKVKADVNARLGEHTCRVVTNSGISDVRLFYVTPFPLLAAVKNPKEPGAAQPVALGTTIYGRLPNEQQDKFQVELTKGERLSVEMIGMRLSTQAVLDPALTIRGPQGGVVAEVDDCSFSRHDPVASILAPADGKYEITVRDSTNSGQGMCNYLLTVGTFARPLVAYPLGGPAAQELKVQLIGDPAGVIERTIELPADSGERFGIFTEESQPTPRPNGIRISPLPNFFETEPNNSPDIATPLNAAPPLAFNGIIQAKGDMDCFKFSARKGTDYDVRVFARQLRSPLDSVIEIYDAKGNHLADNDDAGGPDSYLRWKAPDDGEFTLLIRDQLWRGGPTWVYRVELTTVQPAITAYLPEMVPNQNQERRAVVVPRANRYATLVRVKRQDIAGEIALEPTGLPAGVTATAPLIDKSVDTVPVVFEAEAGAPRDAGAFIFKSQLTTPSKDNVVTGAIEHSVDIVEVGNQAVLYSITESQLPIAVTDEIPVKLELDPPKAQLLQNGSLVLKVRAERTGEFKGPINVALLYTPPGLGSAGGGTIAEGQNEGALTLSANGDAPLRKWKMCVVGSADFGSGPVWFSTQLVEVEVAAPFVAGKIVRSFMDQGDTSTLTVKLEHKRPFDGTARVQLVGLPPNTSANSQDVTQETTEVKFAVKAESNAPPATHRQLFCQFTLANGDETMTSAFAQGGILRIDRAAVAKNEEAEK